MAKHYWYASAYIRLSKTQSLDHVEFIASAINPFWSLSVEGRETFKLGNYLPDDQSKITCLSRGLNDLIFAICAYGIMMVLRVTSSYLLFSEFNWHSSYFEFVKKICYI